MTQLEPLKSSEGRTLEPLKTHFLNHVPLIAILFLLFSLSVVGQNKNNYWLMENNGNNEEGSLTLIPKNGASYSNSKFVQGTYSLFCGATYQRAITSGKIDLTSGAITISGWYRPGTGSSVGVIMTNRTAGGDKQGFSIDRSDQRLRVIQDFGASEGAAYSANNSLPGNTWIHYAVVFPDVTGDVARIYINGVRSGTDSITASGGQKNDTLCIGALRDGAYYAYGYHDQISTYDRALTDAEVLDIYNHPSEVYYLSEEEPYEPPVTYEPSVWMKYKGVKKIPKYKGRTLYVGYKPLSPEFEPYFKPGLDNRLSHDQYMVTYDGALDGWIVGTFDPWYVTQYRIPGVFTFTLTDNEDGIYAINPTTGIITIADNETIVDGIDTLRVSIALGSIIETYNVFVTVKDVSDVIHVKPGAATNGTGTRLSPKNTWSGMVFEPGKMYLQERGTVSNVGINFNVNGTAENPIIIAAYGSALAKPVIKTNYSGYGITVRADYSEIYEFNLVDNIGAIRIPPESAIYQHHVWSDVECSGSSGTEAQVYIHKPANGTAPPYWWWDFDIKMYDFQITGTGDATTKSPYGMKLEGGTVNIRNAKTLNNRAQGISAPYMGHGNVIDGLLSRGNTHYAIEFGGRNGELKNSYCEGGWSAFMLMDAGSDTLNIHHNEFVGGGYRGTMWLSGTTNLFQTTGWTGAPTICARNVVIENNIIRGSTYVENGGIVITGAMNDVRIRKNYIYNHPTGIRLSTSSTYLDSLRNIQIDQNVFYNNTNYDIYNLHATGVYARNNSMTGATFSTPSMYFLNNIYKTLTSPGPSNNNIDIDAIDVNTYFVNWAENDLRLKSTATLAIDHGLNLGLTLDIDGVIVPQGTSPDIGAYEYK